MSHKMHKNLQEVANAAAARRISYIKTDRFVHRETLLNGNGHTKKHPVLETVPKKTKAERHTAKIFYISDYPITTHKKEEIAIPAVGAKGDEKGVFRAMGGRLGFISTAAAGLVILVMNTIGLPTPASAQEKGKPATVLLAADNKGEATAKQMKIPVPKATMELKDGMLTYSNIEMANAKGELVSYTTDIRRMNEENKQKNEDWRIPETVPNTIIAAKVSGYESVIYLVYDNLVVGLFKSDSEVVGAPAYSKDGSRIFMNKEAIYVSSDGSFVATTPTTLFLVSPSRGGGSIRYSESYQGFPLLKKPTIREGNGPGYADLRDEQVMPGYKIQITITKSLIEVMHDMIGAR